MKKTLAAVLLVAFASTPLALAELAKHPHLKRAHEAIEHAMKALREANDKEKGEFGGHRVKAEELLNQAQHEIEEAANWADSHK